ncbi:MAG TPA: hypothetical protein PKI17_05020 [Syntrophomonas sp.]|nr:hypothetical protein [Syntrophomonas sp.]
MLIIGFMVLSFCSTAYVYQSTYAVSGKLDSKTNDEFAHDSVKGNGDQVCSRTLESDYGFSKLFSRYVLKNTTDENNTYSMSLDANGVSHGVSFSGADILSSNMVKFDDNSGVASYFNMKANGTMDESLKLSRDDALNNDLVASKVEGMFTFKSSFTEVKTPEYDTLRLSAELASIDLDSILTGIPESGDPDLNVTKMQAAMSNDLENASKNDVLPNDFNELENFDEPLIGTTIKIEPISNRLDVTNTSAYYQLKRDNVFVHSVQPVFNMTREEPLKLGRYPMSF